MKSGWTLVRLELLSRKGWFVWGKNIRKAGNKKKS